MEVSLNHKIIQNNQSQGNQLSRMMYKWKCCQKKYWHPKYSDDIFEHIRKKCDFIKKVSLSKNTMTEIFYILVESEKLFWL